MYAIRSYYDRCCTCFSLYSGYTEYCPKCCGSVIQRLYLDLDSEENENNFIETYEKGLGIFRT